MYIYIYRCVYIYATIFRRPPSPSWIPPRGGIRRKNTKAQKSTYIYINMYIYTYVCTYVHKYLCMYIYMCIVKHVYNDLSKPSFSLWIPSRGRHNEAGHNEAGHNSAKINKYNHIYKYTHTYISMHTYRDVYIHVYKDLSKTSFILLTSSSREGQRGKTQEHCPPTTSRATHTSRGTCVDEKWVRHVCATPQGRRVLKENHDRWALCSVAHITNRTHTPRHYWGGVSVRLQSNAHS